MSSIVMLHEGDPKAKLLNDLGDISGIDLFNAQVLCAIYLRPQKTKNGIFLTDRTVDEDRYQSKVGLLIKVGDSAFSPGDGWWMKGDVPRVGDWVIFRAADGWDTDIHGVKCRMLSDTAIRGRVSQPDELW